jgi:hypothetical protein
MIKLEVDVRDIDYDGLIDRFLPMVLEKLRQSENTASKLVAGGLPASVAKAILKNLPRATKEQLAAELLNSNREAVIQYLCGLAGQNGIRIKIGDLRAKTADG